MSESRENLRRVSIDLPPTSMQRLERLRAVTDATGYSEVIRAALRDYEDKLAEQMKRVAAAKNIP